MRQYRFLSVNLAVSGSDALLHAIHARLRYFPSAEGAPDMRFEYLTRAQGAAHGVSRPRGPCRRLSAKADTGLSVEYFPEGDQLYMSCGERAVALCDVGEARVAISVAQPEAENLWIATHPIFVIALFELLKRRGYFNVHAAAVCLGRQTLLFAGHSTAGKSTLAVSLCRAGFGFMSDDYVFLKSHPRGMTILGFPEELDLLDSTAAMFPELHAVPSLEKRRGWSKRQVRVEDYWDVPMVSEGEPAILMFPSVAGSRTSTIEPMAAQDAIAQLVGNVQYTQPSLAQAHLDLLGDLVRTSACFRLNTGRDLDVLPDRLRELVGMHRLTPSEIVSTARAFFP